MDGKDRTPYAQCVMRPPHDSPSGALVATRTTLLVALVITVLASPCTANAGELAATDSSIRYVAAAGEANRVRVTLSATSLTLTDEAGAAPGTGCSRPDPADGRTVACEYPDPLQLQITLGLRDQNDQLAIVGAAPSEITIRGGVGDDRLAGGAGFELFDEGADTSGSDTITGGPEQDRVSYASRRRGLRVSLDGQRNDGQRGERDNVGADVEGVVGGRGSDRLVGNGRPNELGEDAALGEGGGGSDRLIGKGGKDVLAGGDGSDVLVGGPGDDHLEETDEERRSSRNRLDGGPGEDGLTGGAGASLLIGGPGSDGIDDGSGPDTIRVRDRSSDDVVCTGRGDLVLADRRDFVTEGIGGGGRFRRGRFELGCRLQRRGLATALPGGFESIGEDEETQTPPTHWAVLVACPADTGRKCRGTARIALDGRARARRRFSIARDEVEEVYRFPVSRVRPGGSILTVRVSSRDRSRARRRHAERYRIRRSS
jgi:hemolysin type calcium-binding protein